MALGCESFPRWRVVTETNLGRPRSSPEQGFLSDAGGASYINRLEKFMGWEKCVGQMRGFIKQEIVNGVNDPGRGWGAEPLWRLEFYLED